MIKDNPVKSNQILEQIFKIFQTKHKPTNKIRLTKFTAMGRNSS